MGYLSLPLSSDVGTLRDGENCIHKLLIWEVGNMSNVLMEILRGLNESFRHLNLYLVLLGGTVGP